MRIVIQRVSHASVTIEGKCKSAIGKGMLILVGIEEADGQEDIDWLCKKIVNLRIFSRLIRLREPEYQHRSDWCYTLPMRLHTC